MQYCTVKKKNIIINLATERFLFAALLYALWNRLAWSIFFFFLLDSRQQSANGTDEAGNTSQRSRARCLLQTPDCPQHTEYACGLQRSERMGMNNKRCYDNAERYSASVLLFLHLSRMHERKRHRNKINIFREKKKKRATEMLTFLHFGRPKWMLSSRI